MIFFCLHCCRRCIHPEVDSLSVELDLLKDGNSVDDPITQFDLFTMADYGGTADLLSSSFVESQNSSLAKRHSVSHPVWPLELLCLYQTVAVFS